MSDDAELGHQQSVSSDLEPRWIDHGIHKITIGVSVLFGAALVVCMFAVQATAFLWVLLAAIVAIAPMVYLRLYVRTSDEKRRENETARQNHRLNDFLSGTLIDDARMNSEADAVIARHREEDEEAAARKAERRAILDRRQAERDRDAGDGTNFKKIREQLKDGIIAESNAYEKEQAARRKAEEEATDTES